MQGEGLEHHAGDHGGDAAEPHGAAQQVDDEPQAQALGARRADRSPSLQDRAERVGAGREHAQRELDHAGTSSTIRNAVITPHRLQCCPSMAKQNSTVEALLDLHGQTYAAELDDDYDAARQRA